MKSRTFALMATVGVLVAGCSPNPVPSPPPPPSGVWEITIFRGQNDSTPITTSQVWMGDEVVFLIVPDFKRAGGGGGGGSGGVPYKAWFHGGMYLPDGKTEVRFQAETVKGEIESVTIAEKSYDLKNGRLFFVSSDGDLNVKQVNQDTRSLTPQHDDPKGIEAFLRNVPEFEAFLPNAGITP